MALSFIDLDNYYLIAFEEALSVRETLVYLAFSMNECRNMDINKSQIQVRGRVREIRSEAYDIL
jgi:hypothetical protein